MCGISGFFNTSDFDANCLKTMTEKIKHRGPDNTDYYTDEVISLGHVRLSILDLSQEANQPFVSNNDRYIMVYNGEVYNFKELAREMNYEPKTTSDTEVILESYCRYGNEFIEKLNGMFSIVIYDKELGTINVWRDRFGIKPFYYYFDGKSFAFASELKALYTLPLKKEINNNSFHDYLFLEYVPQGNSMVKHFHKLAQGRHLWTNGKEVKIDTYYSILDKVKEPTLKNEEQALEQFESLFEESLERRQIADVPIGAFLSGGIDSSSICLGLSKKKAKLNSFNISFDEDKYSEAHFARDVALALNLNHAEFKLKSEDLIQDFQEILQSYDEPFAVSSVFPTYRVSQLARKDIKVALSGDGGDELFMGYGHYQWLDRLKNYDSRLGKALRYSASAVFSMMPSRYKRISVLLKYNNISNNWPHVWSQEQYMFSEPEINRLTSQTNFSNSLNNKWLDISRVTSDKNLQLSLFDIENYLADDLLYKVDIASMANGLEVRLPFLDHKLVEFAVNLPSSMKVQQKNQKIILKNYLSQKLSKELIERKKWGFGAPIDTWLKKDLRFLFDQYLTKDRMTDAGLDFIKIDTMIKSFLSGNSYNHFYKKLWALIVFEIWKDNYLKAH